MIKRNRIKKGLTQSQLAEKLGKTKSCVNKLENRPNTYNPTVNLILKLSKELELDPVKTFLYFVKNKDQD